MKIRQYLIFFYFVHSTYTSLIFDYSLSLSLNVSFRRVTATLSQAESIPACSPAPAAELTLIRISSGSAVLRGEGFNHPAVLISFLEWVWGKHIHKTPLPLVFPAHSLPSLQSRPHFLPQPASFCFLPGCAHRLPMAPQGIALLLPQLQSVHISLN